MINKQKLFDYASVYVAKRVETIEAAIYAARQASSSDTKSSMGDKYETTREMMAIEIAQNERQLVEAIKLRDILAKINLAKSYAHVATGALVETNWGIFFISVAIGSVKIEDTNCFIIDINSPLAKHIQHLKAGDLTIFNTKPLNILSIS